MQGYNVWKTEVISELTILGWSAGSIKSIVWREWDDYYNDGLSPEEAAYEENWIQGIVNAG